MNIPEKEFTISSAKMRDRYGHLEFDSSIYV
jgi:hypothetical protein